MTLLWKHWSNRIRQGQEERSLIGRQLVFRLNRELFDVLDFADDSPFLEPILVAAALEDKPQDAIYQAVVGYLQSQLGQSSRWSLGAACHRIEFMSQTNEEGYLVFPGLGSFATQLSSQPLPVTVCVSPDQRTLTVHSELAQLPFHPEIRLGKGKFQLVTQRYPIVNKHIFDVHGERVDLPTLIKNDSLCTQLESALMHIEKLFPEFYEALLNTSKGYALFSNSSINSFASETIHGIAFLSTPKCPSIAYFLEDLLHQSGHIMFSSMFFSHEDLLSVPRNTPMSQYTNKTKDPRSIFVVGHAVFTEYTITEGLLRCLEANALSSRDQFETQGRLALMLARYSADLSDLWLIPDFQGDGRLLRLQLSESFTDIYERSLKFITQLDLSAQEYVFNMDVFETRNSHIFKS